MKNTFRKINFANLDNRVHEDVVAAVAFVQSIVRGCCRGAQLRCRGAWTRVVRLLTRVLNPAPCARRAPRRFLGCSMASSGTASRPRRRAGGDMASPLMEAAWGLVSCGIDMQCSQQWYKTIWCAYLGALWLCFLRWHGGWHTRLQQLVIAMLRYFDGCRAVLIMRWATFDVDPSPNVCVYYSRGPSYTINLLSIIILVFL